MLSKDKLHGSSSLGVSSGTYIVLARLGSALGENIFQPHPGQCANSLTAFRMRSVDRFPRIWTMITTSTSTIS